MTKNPYLKTIIPIDVLDVIDQDNVNDFAFHVTHKSKLFGDPIKSNLKSEKMKPAEYALKHEKYKILYYLFTCHFQEIFHEFHYFDIQRAAMNKNAPRWYKLAFYYGYIYNYEYEIQRTKKFTRKLINDTLDLVMSDESPAKCLSYIINKIQTCGERHSLQMETFRKLINKSHSREPDSEVFNQLSLEKRHEFIKVAEENTLRFNISFTSIEDPRSYVYFHNFYKFVEQADQSGKKELIFKFFDDSKTWFTYLNDYCEIIIPKFKAYYEYAFSNSKINKDATHQKSKLAQHLTFLIDNLYVEEIVFINSKGDPWNGETSGKALSAFNKMLTDTIPKNRKQDGINYLFEQTSQKLRAIEQITGIYPSDETVKNCLLRKKYNLSFINLLNPNLPLDYLRDPFIKNQINYVKEFAKQYEHRMKYQGEDGKRFWGYAIMNNCENLSPDKYMDLCNFFQIDHMTIIKNSLQTAFYQKNMSLFEFLLKFKPDVSDNSDYLEYAIKNDLVKLAAELVRLGSRPEMIRKWKKRSSYEMQQAIINNL